MPAITYRLCRCLKCGYEWSSPVARPAKCPECQSRKWDEEKGENG